MKTRIHTSDLELLLQMIAPEYHELHIFDPFKRLIVDNNINIYKNESFPKVLVNMASEVISSELWMEEFDYIIDFGNGNRVSAKFESKSFRFINDRSRLMRWIYPSDLVKPTFLNFSEALNPAQKIKKGMFRILFASGLKKLVESGSFSVHYQKPLKFEKSIHHLCYGNYSIHTRPFNTENQVMIELNTRGKTTNFVKMILNEHEPYMIENLVSVLDTNSHEKFGHFVTNENILPADTSIMTVSPSNPGLIGSQQEISFEHFNKLEALYHETACVENFESTGCFRKLSDDFSELEKGTRFGQMDRIWTKLQRLKSKIDKDILIPVADSQGDFTPWIMYVADDKLYTYEWELSRNRMPVLFDLFHCVFQSGVLMKHQNMIMVKKEFRRALEHPAARRIIQHYHLDVNLHYELYLLLSISHFLNISEQKDFLNSQTIHLLDAWEEALSNVLTEPLVEDAQREFESVKQRFVSSFLSFMSPLKYALMRYYDGLFDNIEDTVHLELLVKQRDVYDIVNYIRYHDDIDRIKVHRISCMTSVELYFRDHTYLNIDFIFEIKRKWMNVGQVEEILETTRLVSGISLPEPKFDVEYGFLYFILNGRSIPEVHKKYYLSMDADNKAATKMYLLQKYIISYRPYESLFEYSTELHEALLHGIYKLKGNNGISQLKNILRYSFDTIRGLGRKKGLLIALRHDLLLGEGEDRREIIDHLSAQFGKRVVMIRREGDRFDKQSQLNSRLRQPTGDPIFFTWRYSRQFLSYSIDQIFVNIRYVLNGYVVLYDHPYLHTIDTTDSRRLLYPAGMIRAMQKCVRQQSIMGKSANLAGTVDLIVRKLVV